MKNCRYTATGFERQMLFNHLQGYKFLENYPESIINLDDRCRVDIAMSEAKPRPRISALGVFKEIFNWYPSHYPAEERR
jgi:hypothetical protein